MASWKERAGTRKLSTAQLNAEAMFSNANASNQTIAQMQATAKEFKYQRERKRKHRKQRVKELSHRPLSAIHHTGDPSFRLAMLMSNGANGVHQDDEHALVLLRQASAIKHTGSLTALGEFDQAGRGRDRNGLALDRPKNSRALHSFQQAARKGDPHAALRLAICLETTDLWEARKWYRLAAKHGLADAQFNFGMLSIRMFDFKEAHASLKRASKQHHLGAINNLGMLHLMGQGCQQDSARARIYFELGSSLNDPYAMVNLGLLHKKEWQLRTTNASWCDDDESARAIEQHQRERERGETQGETEGAEGAEKNARILEMNRTRNIRRMRTMVAHRSPGWLNVATKTLQEIEIEQSRVATKERQRFAVEAHVKKIRTKATEHLQQAEMWFDRAAEMGHPDAPQLLMEARAVRGSGGGDGVPPATLDDTNSAFDFNHNSLHGEESTSMLLSPLQSITLPSFEPSTTLSSHPLSHKSLGNSMGSSNFICSPKRHRILFNESYYGNMKQLDGLNLRPHTAAPTRTRILKSAEAEKISRPKASAFFWGDRTTSGTSPIAAEKERNHMRMNTRISRIHETWNQGKYFTPKTSSKSSSKSSNKRTTTTPAAAATSLLPRLERKKSVTEVEEILKMNELMAGEHEKSRGWPATLRELKELCIERGIRATTQGIFNPKDKAIQLRSRVMQAIHFEKKNLMNKIRNDASQLSGSVAREKKKLGLRLTSLERRQLRKNKK